MTNIKIILYIMKKSLHVFLSLFLLTIVQSASGFNHSDDRDCLNPCLENHKNQISSLMMEPLVVSLVCPATPGSSGSESEQTTITVGATDATGSGSITFPSGIYDNIPPEAVNINVALTTTIETFGASWLSEVIISTDAPGTFADAVNYQPSMTNGGGTETYVIDYGDNDPTGLWDFSIFEQTNDTGIDSEVTFDVTLSWTIPATPSDCDTIVCDANSFVLDTELPGLTYNWSTSETSQSITVTESGTYTVTVSDGTETAVDDITVIFGASEAAVDANICDGQTYTVGTSTYDMTGVYTDVLNSYTGCDSTIITNLTVGDAGTTEIFPIVCNGGSHTTGTSTYDTTGEYTDVLPSSQGCDSTVITHLTVLSLIEQTVDTTICFGETYTIGDNSYDESGNYTDVLLSYQNCDSTVTTNLTVLPEYNESQDITICFGESYEIGGSTYNSDGNYSDVLVSAAGCDSTVLTNLTVLPENIVEDSVTICFGESHDVGSSSYNASGDYEDVLISYQNCDSTVMTHLIVLEENMTETFVQICDGNAHVVGDSTYTVSGDYTNILPAASGCDSMILTHLDVVMEINEELDILICDGESYTVGDSNYTVSGDYVDTLESVNGCDSIVTLHLDVAPVAEENNVHVLCFGEVLNVGNNTYNSDGSYSDTLMTAFGCDSIIHSDLTILEEIIEENTITLCFGNTLTVGNNTYDISGDYMDTLVSGNGCDSTIITHLTVLNEMEVNITAQICQGQTYMEGSSTYTSSGTYMDTYTSVDGCDSTIITSLTVVDQIDVESNILICPGASHTVGTSTYTMSGTYMDTLIASGGCDSIITTNLAVYMDNPTNQEVSICFGDSYMIGSSNYNQSGTYTDVIPSVSGCDSTVVTMLTVIGDGSYANNVQICEGDIYMIGNNSYNTAGTYTDVLTSSMNCDSVVVTNLDVVSVINTDETVLLCEGDSYQGTVYETSTTLINEGQSSNGCDSIHTITIIVSEGLEMDLIIQDDVCAVNQGSITAAVFGGIPPYNYAWNSGDVGSTLEDLGAGLYEVTVSDANGCTVVAPGLVNTTPGVTIVSDVTHMNCNENGNGAIDITVATGTAPYVFNWNGPNGFISDTEDIDNLAPGSYTIIIYDANGCGFGTSIEVTEPDPLVVDVITSPGMVVAAVTGGTAPYQYFWSNGATTPSLTNIEAGNYFVTISDDNGCFITADAVVPFNTAVEEMENFIALNILPNPSAGQFIIDLEMSVVTNLNFNIYNLDGKTVYQHSVEGMKIQEEIDLTHHSSGTYLLVIDDGKNRKVERIVVTR